MLIRKLFLNIDIIHLMNQVKIISSQNHQIKIFIDHWIKSGEESALINILEYKNLFNLNIFIILLGGSIIHKKLNYNANITRYKFKKIN